MTDNNKCAFESFGFGEDILKAIRQAGYETPSPIQAKSIPPILEGRDILGCAQTGSGKTAAFCLPIIERITSQNAFPMPYCFTALILTPTRELAEQIADNVKLYSKFTHLTSEKVFGGVSQRPQIKSLQGGLDILVATPGRLLDLWNQKKVNFGQVKYLVLDEADRMLDMGFLPDIRKICKMLPNDRQSLLFSATLDGEIGELASQIVKNPLKISVNPESPTVERIAQKLYYVERANKFDLLSNLLKNKFSADVRALIFCRTKHGADRLAKKLSKAEIPAEAIHSDKSQAARRKSLQDFKDSKVRVLTATDIAARGLDIKEMPLVINYEMPEECETYIHRIGRTARANSDGVALSFCAPEEIAGLKRVEKLIKRRIEVESENPYHFDSAYNFEQDAPTSNKQQRRPRKGGVTREGAVRRADIASKRKDFGNEDSKRKNPRGERTDKVSAKENAPRRENQKRKNFGSDNSRTFSANRTNSGNENRSRKPSQKRGAKPFGHDNNRKAGKGFAGKAADFFKRARGKFFGNSKRRGR